MLLPDSAGTTVGRLVKFEFQMAVRNVLYMYASCRIRKNVCHCNELRDHAKWGNVYSRHHGEQRPGFFKEQNRSYKLSCETVSGRWQWMALGFLIVWFSVRTFRRRYKEDSDIDLQLVGCISGILQFLVMRTFVMSSWECGANGNGNKNVKWSQRRDYRGAGNFTRLLGVKQKSINTNYSFEWTRQ